MEKLEELAGSDLVSTIWRIGGRIGIDTMRFRDDELIIEYQATTDASTPEDHIGMARALTSTGRPDDAVGRLTAAARQYPDSAQLQAELGLLLLELGRMDDATPYLYRAVELNGASTKAAHMALGEALFDEGRYPEAAKVLDSYNQRYPGDFDVNMRLGFIYFQNGSFKFR